MLNYRFDTGRIQSARVESKMSQNQMAKAIGITRLTYLTKESGKRSFTVPELVKVAEITSKPVEYFFQIYVTDNKQDVY